MAARFSIFTTSRKASPGCALADDRNSFREADPDSQDQLRSLAAALGSRTAGARCNTRVARLGPACFAAAVRARCWPSATTRPRSPDDDVAVAAIVRSWVRGIASNLQAQPLPWLAYFGFDGAHGLI